MRVNAIAPSLTASEMTRAMPEKVLDKMIASIPLGRQAEPEEIAETIAALASPATAYVTGRCWSPAAAGAWLPERGLAP